MGDFAPGTDAVILVDVPGSLGSFFLRAGVAGIDGNELLLDAPTGLLRGRRVLVYVDAKDAIDRAVDRVRQDGGGILYFPPGTYAISDEIAFGQLDPVPGPWVGSILGAGRGSSTIKLTKRERRGPGYLTTSGFHLIRTRNVTIRGLTFEGTGYDDQVEMPIHVDCGPDWGAVEDRNERVNVADVEVTSSTYGIYLRHVRQATVTQCYVHGLVGRDFAVNNGFYGYGILCEGGVDNEVSFNLLEDVPRHCVYISNGARQYRVVGNRMLRARNGAIEVYSAVTPDGHAQPYCQDIPVHGESYSGGGDLVISRVAERPMTEIVPPAADELGMTALARRVRALEGALHDLQALLRDVGYVRLVPPATMVAALDEAPPGTAVVFRSQAAGEHTVVMRSTPAPTTPWTPWRRRT